MRYLFIILNLTWGSLLFSQQHNRISRSELGIMLGGAHYLGDLNPFFKINRIKPAASIFYRYHKNPRLTFRANFTYGSVEASDQDASWEIFRNRNLDFKSNIFELGAGVEFHYLKFQLGSKRHRGTAYLLAELALFRMNPMGSTADGGWTALQPLATEGQGTDLSNRGRYSLIQLAIPLGVGAKFSLGPKMSIGVEAGIRKTFTDYLDDVGSNEYIDPVVLAATNGPTAAAMSNKSLDGNRFGKRGNAATNDWYTFFGLTLSIRLGKPNRCYEF